MPLFAAARQVGRLGRRPCASWCRCSRRRSTSRARACPGRCSSSARSTCSTTRRWCASGTARAARGAASRGAALRLYLQRHAAQALRRRRPRSPARRRADPAAAARARRTRARPRPAAQGQAAGARARRPGAPLVADAGAGAGAGEGGRGASARRSTWPAAPAACSAPATLCSSATSGGEALREADLVLLAGIPFDFRLDYGRAHQPQGLPDLASTAASSDLRKNRKPDLGVHADPRASCSRWPIGGSPAGRRRWADWLGDAARAATASASGRSTRQAAVAGERVNPHPPLPRDRPRARRRERDRGRRRRLRGDRRLHRAPARAALLARSRRLRHARRGRRLRPRRQARAGRTRTSGSSTATARRPTASPSSTPSSATACR